MGEPEGRTPSRPRYTKFFWKDFISDTQHLTATQVGAYTRLLAHAVICSSDFCSVPDDSPKQSRITGVDRRNWRKIGPEVMRLFECLGSVSGEGVSGRCQQKRLREDASEWLQHCEKQRLRRTAGQPPDDRGLTGGQPHSRERASRETSDFRLQKESTPPPTPAPAASGGNGVVSRNGHHPENVSLPDWLDREVWTDYWAHRRAKKAPLTPRAVTLSLNKLDKLRGQGFSPREVVDQSIARSWVFLFAISPDKPVPPPAEAW